MARGVRRSAVEEKEEHQRVGPRLRDDAVLNSDSEHGQVAQARVSSRLFPG